MIRTLRIVVFIGLLLGLLHDRQVLHAQEAAVVNFAKAVRFEQSPGFYHYVVFCKTPKEFTAQMPAGKEMPGAKSAPGSMEYGLCWYVDGAKTSGGGSKEADGRLIVSEHHLRFMPRDPQAADLYFDLPREQAGVEHEAGQPNAILQGKGVKFSFRFSKLCLTCPPGTPTPPGVAAAGVLDQEFALLDETILHYYSGWKEIYRISSGAPANSRAGNEPSNSATTPAPRVVAPPASSPGTSTVSEAASPSPAATTGAAAPLLVGGPKRKPVKIVSGAADGLLVKKVPPNYPLEAKLVRLEGTVILRAVIDTAGEVSEVNAVSGPPLLESAAVEAVKQWQYRPYLLNGQPVDVETTIAIVFALDGNHPANRPQSAHR